MRNTKEQILLTALELFAREGFDAVSVRDIAAALGLSKGALYRHYQSKREIFESILRRMERRDAQQARDRDLPEETAEQTPAAYQGASLDDIAAFSKDMFRYWTEDPFASRFRRLLTLEQFRNAEMGALYQQYLAAGPLEYLRDLFSAQGLARPQEEAALFYGQMFLLYSVYDGSENRQAATELADRLIDGLRDRLQRLQNKERRKEP